MTSDSQKNGEKGEKSTEVQGVRLEQCALRKKSKDRSSTLGSLIPCQSSLGQTVLSEEEYTSTLSRLIKRDFFPHLDKLKAQNAYLDNLMSIESVDDEVVEVDKEGNDHTVWHHRSKFAPTTDRQTPQVKYPVATSTHTTPSINPSQCATQFQSDDQKEAALDAQPSLHGLSLTSFQQNFTSEDNASFLELMAKEKQKRREAFRWAYEEEQKANDKRDRALKRAQNDVQEGHRLGFGSRSLEINRRIRPSAKTSSPEAKEIAGATVDPITSLRTPQRENIRKGRKLDIAIATASNGQQHCSFKARNALFFGPDADRDTLSRRTSSLSDRAKSFSPSSKRSRADLTPAARTLLDRTIRTDKRISRDDRDDRNPFDGLRHETWSSSAKEPKGF